MSGFLRQPQPAALDRASLTGVVRRFVAEQVSFANRTRDPFGIADPCPRNPGGHRFIASCGDVVCLHCSRIAWS
jgi:hypothetical protein